VNSVDEAEAKLLIGGRGTVEKWLEAGFKDATTGR
jgi:hypothetical protein